jgi:hypothetical protein
MKWTPAKYRPGTTVLGAVQLDREAEPVEGAGQIDPADVVRPETPAKRTVLNSPTGRLSIVSCLKGGGNSIRGIGNAWRSVRSLVGAGAEHQLSSKNRTLRRVEEEATRPMARDRANVSPFSDRGLDSQRIALEILDDLVPKHKAVRIAAVVRVAAKLDAPVERDQAETVPAATPGLADAPPLEDDVLDAALRQLAADRDTGLSGAAEWRPA